MMPFRATVVLILSAVSSSMALAAPETRQPRMQTPSAVPQASQAPPVTHRMGTSIHLSSSRPDLAAVPAGVVVPLGTTDAGFKVTTMPVSAPTQVTITACSRPCGQPGAETKATT